MNRLRVISDIQNASFVVTGNLAKANVGGSLVGGSDGSSGRVASNGDIGEVQINGDIRGGAGLESGLVSCKNLKSMIVGGSLIAGPNVQSGCIYVSNDCDRITIKGDIVGDKSGSNTPQPGSINVEGTSRRIVVGGSIVAGSFPSSGAINQKGAKIVVMGTINA